MLVSVYFCSSQPACLDSATTGTILCGFYIWSLVSSSKSPSLQGEPCFLLILENWKPYDMNIKEHELAKLCIRKSVLWAVSPSNNLETRQIWLAIHFGAHSLPTTIAKTKHMKSCSLCYPQITIFYQDWQAFMSTNVGGRIIPWDSSLIYRGMSFRGSA